jgi:AcrR family transcriptional regulator
VNKTEVKVDRRTERATAIRAERRAHILESAIRTFSEKGYHQTSIADIVEAAGVARGTFYLYFESKSTVFLALLDELLAHLRANVIGVDVRPGAAPLAEQLLDIVRRVLRTALEKRALANIIFREAIGLDEEVDQKLRDFYGSLHRFLIEALRMGQQGGAVRATLDVDATASCILGSIKQVLEQYLVHTGEQAFDVERFARAIVEYNLNGVLAR